MIARDCAFFQFSLVYDRMEQQSPIKKLEFHQIRDVWAVCAFRWAPKKTIKSQAKHTHSLVGMRMGIFDFELASQSVLRRLFFFPKTKMQTKRQRRRRWRRRWHSGWILESRAMHERENHFSWPNRRRRRNKCEIDKSRHVINELCVFSSTVRPTNNWKRNTLAALRSNFIANSSNGC